MFENLKFNEPEDVSIIDNFVHFIENKTKITEPYAIDAIWNDVGFKIYEVVYGIEDMMMVYSAPNVFYYSGVHKFYTLRSRTTGIKYNMRPARIAPIIDEFELKMAYNADIFYNLKVINAL